MSQPQNYQPYSTSPQFYGPPARPPVSTLLVVIAWVVGVCTLLYMLPWAIATTRNKSNMWAIGALNLFLGWSLIGWIVSMVMACSAEHSISVSTVVVQAPPAMPYGAQYPSAAPAQTPPPPQPYGPPPGQQPYRQQPTQEIPAQPPQAWQSPPWSPPPDVRRENPASSVPLEGPDDGRHLPRHP